MNALLSRIPFDRFALIGDFARQPLNLLGLLVLVLVVLYGLSVGKSRALISLLAIYVAYMLTVLFPYGEQLRERLPEALRPYGAVVLFLVLYLVVFLLITRAIRRGRLALGKISLLQVVLISIVQLGLLASICIALVAVEDARRFVGPLYPYLGGQRTLWFWAAASLAIMPLMRVRHRDDS